MRFREVREVKVKEINRPVVSKKMGESLIKYQNYWDALNRELDKGKGVDEARRLAEVELLPDEVIDHDGVDDLPEEVY